MGLFGIGDFVRRTGILADFVSHYGDNCEKVKAKACMREKIRAFHSFLVNECDFTGNKAVDIF